MRRPIHIYRPRNIFGIKRSGNGEAALGPSASRFEQELLQPIPLAVRAPGAKIAEIPTGMAECGPVKRRVYRAVKGPGKW